MNNAGQFRIYADVPPVQHDEQLKKYRDAGFTHYIMTEDYIKMRDERGQISSSYIDTLKKLRQMGFRVLIRNHGDGPDYFDGITNQLEPYADGFYMCDEPSYVPVPEYESTYISNLKELVDWYNNYGNNTFFHINLLQTYGVEMLHNQYSYSQYLDHYVEDILKKVKGKKPFLLIFTRYLMMIKTIIVSRKVTYTIWLLFQIKPKNLKHRDMMWN